MLSFDGGSGLSDFADAAIHKWADSQGDIELGDQAIFDLTKNVRPDVLLGLGLSPLETIAVVLFSEGTPVIDPVVAFSEGTPVINPIVASDILFGLGG